MEIADINNVDYSIIEKARNVKRPKGNQSTTNRKAYKSLVCAFDIETTSIDNDNAIMYVWQFQIDNYVTVIGRTWEEFKLFLKRLKKKCAGAWLIAYVHNLSFEFSFLKGIYKFNEEEVFSISGRKVLKCEMMDFLELRCSYYQNNTNLDTLARQWGKTLKESGEEFNYKKKRYPWTKLTKKEIKYIQADVVALVEAMQGKMEYFNDTLYTIPLTATGYVRREVKRIMKGYNYRQLQSLLPDGEITRRLVFAFKGGNVHANRFYAGKIIENVYSWDIASSYPASQVTELYPMGEWRDYQDKRLLNIEKVMELMRAGNSLLMEVVFINIGLKDLNKSLWGCPYLSKHKCIINNGIYDNGRVLYADYLSTYITDIDLKIVLSEYQFDDVIIKSLALSKYGNLPEVLTDYTKELFRQKTLLKGLEDKETEYRLSKERINSIYGMSVTNPLKDEIKYRKGQFERVQVDYLEKIEKENKKAFQSYAWGVWITAHSRYKLERALQEVHPYFIYCDTDSVKFEGDINLDKLNEEYIEKAISVGAYADDSEGNRHYMGVFEQEKTYSKFKTLGAKRYAYEYADGGRGVTISGVNKKLGAHELWDMGGLEAFKDGAIFRLAGGTESVYNDNVSTIINLQGRDFKLTDNVCIKDSTYTLGLTGEYLRIITHPDMWYDIFNDPSERI